MNSIEISQELNWYFADLPTFENAKKGDLGEIAPQKGRFFSPNQESLGRFFHAKEGDWGDCPLQTGDLGEIQLKQLIAG